MLGKLLREIFGAGLRRGHSSAQTTGEKIQFKLPIYQRGATILIFDTGSEGDAHESFVDDLMRPLLPFASSIRRFDVRKTAWEERLNEALEDPVWFVLSYFGAGQNISIQYNGRPVNLWEMAGIPFVRPFGDIPAYYPVAHRQIYLNSINAYGSQEHSEFLHKWLKPIGVTFVFPPILFSPLTEDVVDFSGKIEGKIIFPKNGNDPDALIDYWRMSLPPSIVKALESVGETIVGKNVIDRPTKIDDWVVHYFDSLSVDLRGHRKLFFFMIAQLDDYLRRVKSAMIVRSLLDLPIEVRGTKWQHINFSGKKAKYIQDASVSSTQELIKTSLAVVDMAPNTHFRPHDRVLRAASRFTTFLTNTQTYYTENFDRHKEFCYQFSPESIHNLVENALLHPAETVEVGRYQANRMRMLATDDNYANTFLTALDACALGLSASPDGTQDFVHFADIGA